MSGSRHSSASKCSVARARGTAEAARARAAFSQQELELKIQRARLDLEKATLEANLQALELEKAVAAANTEAEVLKAAAEMEYDDMLSPKSALTLLEVQQRTEAYVAQHAQASLNPNAPLPDRSPLSLKESPPSRHTPASEHQPHLPRCPTSYSDSPPRVCQQQGKCARQAFPSPQFKRKLQELLSAQTDGYLPGLSYLDTPQGINPIVEKLPQILQDKWLSTGSRYKEQHRVCYPPFSFFVDFVRCEAKARNDPSFILTNNSYNHHRNERETGECEDRHICPQNRRGSNS